MLKKIKANFQEQGLENEPKSLLSRRNFFAYAGVGAATTALLLSGCKKDEVGTIMDPTAVDLGSGDVGILNYAYALEQLEAAFYTQVISSKFSGMTAAETQLLTDIRDHEVAHRDFLKAALGSAAIPDLEVDFSSVNFNQRASVLETAKTFEDLGVAAYNGAGKLFSDTGNGLVYLGLAGKIVSVEARHAAAIRSLLSPGTASFAGDEVVSTDKGLDQAEMPASVLAAAAPFIKTKINFSNLPTA
jgi:hypothetical protein